MGKEQRLPDAIDAILPAVQNLSQSEWRRIVQTIDMQYAAKAAKVTLDGYDVENIKRNIIRELF